MAASTDRPSQAPMTTKVTDMPPMTVTTDRIPAAEHVEVAPPPVDRERRTRWIALALSGVLALAAVVALVLGAVLTTPSAYQPRTVLTPPRAGEVVVSTGVHTVDWLDYRAGERAVPASAMRMGLAPDAWLQYRAGERAVVPASALHLGLTPAAWAEYRAGERVVADPTLHMGLGPVAWLDYRAGERLA